MLIIGCDYHPGFQQIAFVDTETGECGERRLTHSEEAEQFYRELKQRGLSVRVGMESSGHARWFERLLRDLQFELWIGDAAEIRSKRVRKQKTDRQDAQLLLRLLMEGRFPRIWVPDAANRDLRQLLWHRHRLVQMRTRVMNQLHVVALNEGLRRKKALWRPAGRNELESLQLAPWASRRRQDLLDLLDQLTPKIQDLTRQLEQEVERRPVTRRLMTHPGVGPLTALAYELVIGTPERFHCGKQIASYVGLVPEENSSGDRRRMGHISKQGNVLLRFLLVEAAQVTVRSHLEWRSTFFHLAMRRGRKIAKVAMARKLAVHLYWMWRQGLDYGQLTKLGSHAESPDIPMVCSKYQEKVQLPQPPKDAESAPPPERTVVVQVVWAAKGTPPTVKINRDDVRWEDLETRLAQIYLKRAEKVAFVRGDADVDFLYIADVIDRAHNAGVQRIGLLTKGQEVAGE